MNDRFKFNAIVSSYYDIDTPENYEEFEPQFYLKNVDVFCTGEIGIDYDALFEAVKEQSKNLTEKEIGQIMKHFEDNSNSPECDFVTIKPDKILQCTGLRDKNEKLIYERDVVRFKDCNDILVINYQKEMACFTPQFYCNGKYSGRLWFDDYDSFECKFYKSNNFEVIGNVYENKDLLNENS